MARTANVCVRVEPQLKEQAEKILSQLGISMSDAIGIFLHQVVLKNGLPFGVKIPHEKPLAYQNLTHDELVKEIEKGMNDIREGRVYSTDEVEKEMKRDFGI